MHWSKEVKNFKLVVYNEKVNSVLNHDRNWLDFLGIYSYQEAKLLFDLDVPKDDDPYRYMAQLGWISASWIDFIKWFREKRFKENREFLFRGVTNYTFRSLLNLRKYGNDRHHPLIDSEITLEEAFRHDPRLGQKMQFERDQAMKEVPGYLPGQFIWASMYLDKAWEHAADYGRAKKTLLLIYNKSNMRSVRDYSGFDYGYAWVPNEYHSFKDSLLAIARIEFY